MIVAVALIVVPCATAAFSLSITTGSPLAVPGVTLNGIDQTTSFTVITSVKDTGGSSGQGWNETASATIPTSAGKVLPALIVTAVSAAGGALTPTNSIGWPITLSTTAVKVFNAALTTGVGTTTLTHTLTMSYPSNALPGTYQSVITFNLIVGP